MMVFGSCGETLERTAARMHSWAALVMFLCVAVEVAGVLLHVTMGAWHTQSVKTHEQRARARGEP